EKASGEAAKQRASEQPAIAYLSPAKACMKIWRFVKGDIAIKWRKIARCGATFPEAWAHVFFGGKSWKVIQGFSPPGNPINPSPLPLSFC
ncbi:MAG: hypothetical protein JSU72_05685, partial [Deltaproteobacteria bacterium]